MTYLKNTFEDNGKTFFEHKVAADAQRCHQNHRVE